MEERGSNAPGALRRPFDPMLRIGPLPHSRGEEKPQSDREARPAAAGGGGVGIVDLEGGADQLVDIVDLRTVQEGQGGFVDHDFRAVTLDQLIVFAHIGIEGECVGEAGAAAAFHAHAQQRSRRLAGEDGVDLSGRGGREGHIGCHGKTRWGIQFRTVIPYMDRQVRR